MVGANSRSELGVVAVGWEVIWGWSSSINALLEIWSDKSHQNWCELIATGLTPDYSVTFTPTNIGVTFSLG